MRVHYAFKGGSVREMELVIGQYSCTDNLYMALRSLDGTIEVPLTVNIEKLGYPYSTLDLNNCSWAADFMETHGIARPIGQSIPSGFCSYPVFAFNTGVLKEIDPKAFSAYQEAHGFLSEKEIDELAKEAKDRAAEKNAQRPPTGKGKDTDLER